MKVNALHDLMETLVTNTTQFNILMLQEIGELKSRVKELENEVENIKANEQWKGPLG